MKFRLALCFHAEFKLGFGMPEVCHQVKQWKQVITFFQPEACQGEVNLLTVFEQIWDGRVSFYQINVLYHEAAVVFIWYQLS